MLWRTPLAILCAAGSAVLGALILGEYEFTGLLPWVAGPLFGLVIGELIVGISRSRAFALGAFAAAAAFGGIAWAGWIDSTEGVEPVKALAWVAAALAGATALLRTVGLRRSPR